MWHYPHCMYIFNADFYILFSGTDNWRVSTLNDHVKSSLHARATDIHNARSQSPAQAESKRALDLLHAEARSHLDKLFRVAHSLGKKGRPYTDFVWQAELLDKCGVAVGDRYRNNKQASEFIKFIAEATRGPLKETLQKAELVSVL